MNRLSLKDEGIERREKSLFVEKEEHPNKKQNLTLGDIEYVKSLFNSGVRHMKANEWRKAEISFSKSLKMYNKNPLCLIKRAKCYLKLKQAEEAESDCIECLKLEPKMLKAKYLRGHAREMMGNLRGACLDFQDIIILDPANQDAKNELERLKPLYKESLRKEGLFKNEEEKGVSEDNTSGIIDVLAGNENPSDEAELEKRAKLANIAKEEGNMYVREKDYNEAKEAYSRAITLNPNESIYYANRALCHLKTNNEFRASLDCSMALRLNPRYLKAYIRRSAARKALGDLWGSREDIKQVLKLEPNDARGNADLKTINQLIENHVYKDLFDQLTEIASSDEEFYEVSNEQQ